MKTCPNCNNSHSNTTYCSIGCSNTHRTLGKMKTPYYKTCLQCSKDFDATQNRRKKFCNHSCAASFTNKDIVRNTITNSKTLEAISTKECIQCKIQLDEINQRYSKYCSRSCSSLHKKEKTIQKWKKDPNSATRKDGGLSLPVREYLLAEAGYKCSKCDWDKRNPFSQKPALEINHIDGDSSNNYPENLEVLCPNCHSLTKNYKALNKKSSRTDRRTKYYQAKLLEEILQSKNVI